MGLSAMLVTADAVSTESLREFVLQLAGHEIPPTSFVLTYSDTHVWLGIQDPEFFSTCHEPEDVNRWQAALGAQPVVGIELRLSHGSKAHELYLYVAYLFSKKWRTILLDTDESIVSAKGIEEKVLALMQESASPTRDVGAPSSKLSLEQEVLTRLQR